jgi:hypothetical protein
MRCEDFRSEIEGVALGEPPSAALARHLGECPACARRLADERRLVAAMDSGLVAALAVAPRAEMAAAVAERIATRPRRRSRARLLALLPVAAALAALALWLRTPPPQEPRPAPVVAELPPPTAPPITAPRAPRSTSVRHSAPTPEPLQVRADPREREGLRRLVAGLADGTIDPKVLEEHAVPPREIEALRIEPLSIPPVGQARSQEQEDGR